MKVLFYLIVNSSGSVKTVKTKPRLAPNEISIRLDLNVPNSLFIKPTLEGTITIPDGAVDIQPITTEIMDNTKKAIEAGTGMKVELTIKNHEE